MTTSNSLIKRMGDFVRRIATDERGATAVEFVLVFPMFMATASMILYVGYVLLAQTLMNEAIGRAADMMKAERVTVSYIKEYQLRAKICDSLHSMLSCDRSRLKLMVTDWYGVIAVDIYGNSILDMPQVNYWSYRTNSILHYVRLSYYVGDTFSFLNPLLKGQVVNGYIQTPIVIATKEQVPRRRSEFDD